VIHVLLFIASIHLVKVVIMIKLVIFIYFYIIIQLLLIASMHLIKVVIVIKVAITWPDGWLEDTMLQ